MEASLTLESFNQLLGEMYDFNIATPGPGGVNIPIVFVLPN
jgi:hypothetical protein